MDQALKGEPSVSPHREGSLHGKTQPDHVHTRAMAAERVDREPACGTEEIVAQESFSEEKIC